MNAEPVEPEDGEVAALPGSVVNAAAVYAALRDDIIGGTTTTVPDFGHAVRLPHLIDDIRSAAGGQTTTPAADWP